MYRNDVGIYRDLFNKQIVKLLNICRDSINKIT